MKKLTLFFLSLLACGLAFQACDNTKTYAEMLEDEKDAIKAFIRDSSITVISQTEFYRNDSTTDVNKNEYVQLASGVYPLQGKRIWSKRVLHFHAIPGIDSAEK